MTRLSIAAAGAPALAIEQQLPKLLADRVASRIAAKDFTLWGKEAESEASIRMGWTDAAVTSLELLPRVEALRAELAAKGVDRVVLCGMGGSSLAPELIANSHGVPLVVLDSTAPSQVIRAVNESPERTVVVVSSKSGSTVETDSQKRAFEAVFEAAGIDPVERIVIVTDPDSPMEQAARERGYRIFNADPTVGGRYSALTAFGLVPSVLAGADMRTVLGDAIEAALLLESDEESNPGLWLGAALARSANRSGGFRDKVGIVDEGSGIVGLGDWVEQLIAESTGKNGKGVLPVALTSGSPELKAPPSDLLVVRVIANDREAHGDEVLVSGPLGAQLLLWEYATVIASRILELNPFDQPDVESAKVAARGMLAGRAPETAPDFTSEEIEVIASGMDVGTTSLTGALEALLAALDPKSGYLSIHAYLDREANSELEQLRDVLAARSGRPTTFGWGPRFLHSTGQYHKGGPAQGVFLQVLQSGGPDLAVPGRDFSFGELIASQAAGDASVLVDHGRPVLTLRLKSAEAFETLLKAAG